MRFADVFGKQDHRARCVLSGVESNAVEVPWHPNSIQIGKGMRAEEGKSRNETKRMRYIDG